MSPTDATQTKVPGIPPQKPLDLLRLTKPRTSLGQENLPRGLSAKLVGILEPGRLN